MWWYRLPPEYPGEQVATLIGMLGVELDREVFGRVEQLLDESVAATAYVIHEEDGASLFDLNAVDW